MWNWLNCYLSGRHDFGVSCEPGAIFLRCIHCGKRSTGWEIKEHQTPIPATVRMTERSRLARLNPAHALPFTPRGVGRLHSA